MYTQSAQSETVLEQNGFLSSLHEKAIVNNTTLTIVKRLMIILQLYITKLPGCQKNKHAGPFKTVYFQHKSELV